MLAVNISAKLPPHLGQRVLLTAIGGGIIADLLLRATPWGLNVLLTVGLLLLGTLVLTRSGRVTLAGEGRWLAIPVLVFAAALAWRDSPTLNVANAIALIVAGALAALTSRAGQLRLAGLTQYGLGIVYLLGYALAGLLPTLRGELVWRWRVAPAVAVGRGLLFAIPPLVLFGALFMAADASFDHLVRTAFVIDARAFVVHLGLMATYAWLIGGTLHEMLVAPLRPRSWRGPDSRIALGGVEAITMLALLDAMFLVFVLIQLPYLFGGGARVAELGYSAYARRGFFELVWVAGLTLPLLLWLHWLIRGATPFAQTSYRILAAVQVGLLFVIMTSAGQRLQLYVADLGLTELRVQAAVFMGWLALVLLWFLATVLRGQRRRFAFGALVSAWLVVVALDVANPDDLIVRTNAHYDHLESALGFDERPLASLSADALPAVVDALPRLSPPAQRLVRDRLTARHGEPTGDWRTFNLSRELAHRRLCCPS
jgi:hypothetical protein